MYIYRILENHGELSNVLDGNTLRDVVSTGTWNSIIL